MRKSVRRDDRREVGDREVRVRSSGQLRKEAEGDDPQRLAGASLEFGMLAEGTAPGEDADMSQGLPRRLESMILQLPLEGRLVHAPLKHRRQWVRFSARSGCRGSGHKVVEHLFNVRAMADRFFLEHRPVGEPQPSGQQRHFVRMIRQRMRLSVEDHLQPVLDGSEEPVGFCKTVCLAAVDQAAFGKPLQRLQRVGRAEGSVPPPVQQLQHLDAELDVADPSRHQFDVQLVADHGFDLGLDAGDIV